MNNGKQVMDVPWKTGDSEKEWRRKRTLILNMLNTGKLYCQ